MFITVAALILGIIVIFAIRDWVHHHHFSVNSVQKSLKKITHFILLQEWDKAENELRQLKKNGKGGREITLSEIQVLRGTGRYQEAYNKATAASRIYPEELLFRFEEGVLLLKLERPLEALTAFQVCSPILRGESDLYFFALAQLKAGHADLAFETLKPFLPMTQNGQVISLVGDVFFERKSFQEAIDAYKYAMDLGYRSHHVCAQLGHAYRRLGNLAKAEEIFRQLHDQDGRDLTAIMGLGACLQERGNYHKAFFIYHSGLVWSRDPSLLQKVAMMALKTNKHRIAETLLFEAMEQGPQDAGTLSYYALALEYQNKWQEAEQCYIKFIHLFPSHCQGYRALAWMFGVGLSQTLSCEQGLNYAHRALMLKNDPLSWEILSACCARIGQFEKAYQIQLTLAKSDQDGNSRIRRQQSLRKLRKKEPLDDHQVLRSQVA